MLGGWGGGGRRFSSFRFSLLLFPQKRLILRLLKILLNAVTKISVPRPYPGRYFDPMILLSQPTKNRNSFYKFHKKYPNRTSLLTQCGPSEMALNNILPVQLIQFSKFLPKILKKTKQTKN